MAGDSRLQELEVVGHIVSKGKEQRREMDAGGSPAFLFLFSTRLHLYLE